MQVRLGQAYVEEVSEEARGASRAGERSART